MTLICQANCQQIHPHLHLVLRLSNNVEQIVPWSDTYHECSETEHQYTQIEEIALGLAFGCQKFNDDVLY